MKNKKLYITIGLLCIYLISILAVNYSFVFKHSNNKKNKDKKIILIDPGHGGRDGGAKGKNGTIEKHINLSIGLKLREEFKKYGYEVFMTREEDRGLYSENNKGKKQLEDLRNRCKLKEESNCDVFISIHLNSYPQSNCRGAQVWYADSEESKKLGDFLQQNLKEELEGTKNVKAKNAKDDYRVLRCSKGITSVLVECGFLSNYEDEKLLNQEEYQLKIAKVISKATKEYLDGDLSKTPLQ